MDPFQLDSYAFPKTSTFLTDLINDVTQTRATTRASHTDVAVAIS